MLQIVSKYAFLLPCGRSQFLRCQYTTLNILNCNNDNARSNLNLTRSSPVVLSERHFKPRRLTWPIDHLPFKWSRPQKIPGIFVSGDNEGIPTVDLNQPKGDFKLSKELVDASEDVKKVFSLEFASKIEVNMEALEQMLSRVRRHPLDNSSIEVRITRRTWRIRLLQDHMRNNMQDKRHKVILNELIQQRNKLLKILSRTHYERFEWLIKELNITYSPPPPGEIAHKVTRKGELRRLTKEYCDNIRQTRLNEYHEKLKAQQQSFLEEKERFLKSIAEEESTA